MMLHSVLSINIVQKINIIRDYLEDINEIPKCRMFWPREIWSKYVNKLEVTRSFLILPGWVSAHILLPLAFVCG